MHPDLQALLELQAEDIVVAELEARVAVLDSRQQALEREMEAAKQTVTSVRTEIEAEEKKRRDLQGKFDQHRQLQDHNLAQLDKVRKAKEGTAALAQIDMARKVLAQEESELNTLSGRVTTLRQDADFRDLELTELSDSQRAIRAEIDAERREVQIALQAARVKREACAQRVSRAILSKYDRIRGRDSRGALWIMQGAACGRCNTAVPMQRRNLIAAGRAIEVCEACGVLLYSTA
ncbi:MAG: zinc ribbon domain-containing protein [Gemmatimonadaceae bacterium]